MTLMIIQLGGPPMDSEADSAGNSNPFFPVISKSARTENAAFSEKTKALLSDPSENSKKVLSNLPTFEQVITLPPDKDELLQQLDDTRVKRSYHVFLDYCREKPGYPFKSGEEFDLGSPTADARGSKATSHQGDAKEGKEESDEAKSKDEEKTYFDISQTVADLVGYDPASRGVESTSTIGGSPAGGGGLITLNNTPMSLNSLFGGDDPEDALERIQKRLEERKTEIEERIKNGSDGASKASTDASDETEVRE